MTESEWLQSADPHAMISFLQEERTHFRTRWQGWMTVRKFRVSERKWRLFYCAVVRRIAHLLPADGCRTLIEVAERHADGQANKEEMQEAIAASMAKYSLGGAFAEDFWGEFEAVSVLGRLLRGEEEGRSGTLRAAASAWATAACSGSFGSQDPAWALEEAAELARQAALLREVIGNPFPGALVDPLWLAWQDGTIPRMAKLIYDEQRFGHLPVLADALEDAGCCDEGMLTHCRSDSAHVLGCWVLDILIAKE